MQPTLNVTCTAVHNHSQKEFNEVTVDSDLLETLTDLLSNETEFDTENEITLSDFEFDFYVDDEVIDCTPSQAIQISELTCNIEVFNAAMSEYGGNVQSALSLCEGEYYETDKDTLLDEWYEANDVSETVRRYTDEEKLLRDILTDLSYSEIDHNQYVVWQ